MKECLANCSGILNATMPTRIMNICNTIQASIPTDIMKPLTSSILAATINAVLAVFTVFINLIIIIAMIRKEQLRTAANMILVSMAVSDFLVGLLVQPLKIAYLIVDTLGLPSCRLKQIDAYVGCLCVGASLFNIGLFALDRCFATVLPYRYLEETIYNKYVATIVTGWSLLTLVSVLTSTGVLHTNVMFKIMTWEFFICLPVTLLSYIIIYRAVRAQWRRIAKVTVAPTENRSNEKVTTLKVPVIMKRARRSCDVEMKKLNLPSTSNAADSERAGASKNDVSNYRKAEGKCYQFYNTSLLNSNAVFTVRAPRNISMPCVLNDGEMEEEVSANIVGVCTTNVSVLGGEKQKNKEKKSSPPGTANEATTTVPHGEKKRSTVAECPSRYNAPDNGQTTASFVTDVVSAGRDVHESKNSFAVKDRNSKDDQTYSLRIPNKATEIEEKETSPVGLEIKVVEIKGRQTSLGKLGSTTAESNGNTRGENSLIERAREATRAKDTPANTSSLRNDRRQIKKDVSRLNTRNYTVAWILGAFLLCYLPGPIGQAIMKRYEVDFSTMLTVIDWGNNLVLLNSAINPIIYCCRVSAIRNEVRKVLHQLARCS